MRKFGKIISLVILTFIMVGAYMFPIGLSHPANAAVGTTKFVYWTDIKAAASSGGSGYLSVNMINYANEVISIPAGKTLTIDLNGYRIEGKVTSSVFDVHGTLNIINSSGGTSSISKNVDYQNGTTALIWVDNGGVLNIGKDNTNGTICLKNNQGTIGGAVQIGSASSTSGTFNMYNKTVIDNCKGTENGGAVSVGKGTTFNMYGGTIQNSGTYNNNAGYGLGGGAFVYAGGTFNMSGGTISNCYAERYGGGLTNKGTFNMSGGTITGCKSNDFGGGGLNNDSVTVMSGGTISGNTAGNKDGHQVRNASSMTIKNYCTITAGSGDISGTLTNNATKTTITLDRQSGTTGSTSVTATYNSNMPSATMPTRTGYTFGGYFTGTNGTGTQYYNANGTSTRAWNQIVAATTLYAKWTENTATLTYNANGYGTAPAAATMKYTAAQNTAAAITGVSGYTFLNWNTKSDGTGTSYNAGAQIKAANVNPTATTLYAQWTTNNTISVSDATQIIEAFRWAPKNGTAITITLAKNIDVNYALNAGIIEYAGQNITLDLNGKTLRQTGTAHTDIIKLAGNCTLHIKDSVGTGKLTKSSANTSMAAVWLNDANAKFYLDSGTIDGCYTSSWGGAVCVDYGQFYMSGGTISNCSAGQYGGGVSIKNGGTFNMTGGTITGCTAGKDGGGVWLAAGTTGTMSNGVIQNCTAYTLGGGICAYGTFNLTGGVICKNTVTFTGTGSGKGGGIWVGGTTTMSGGYIVDNTIARSVSTYGGVGIAGNCTFNMQGGIIYGNKTGDGGNGGVGPDAGSIYNKTGGLVDSTFDLTMENPIAPIVNIKMKDNITFATNDNISFAGNQNVTFDLNGKTLDLNSHTIGVGTSTTFIIKDSGEDGTITNGYNSYGGAICALATIGGASANVIMESGTIENCSSGNNQYGGGAVYLNNNAHFTMNGGTIKDCTAVQYAGAIRIYNNSSFTMNGGTIKNCKVTSTASGVSKGGAVCALASSGYTSTVNMTGGYITGCSTLRPSLQSGGVAISDRATFNMSGGIIWKNINAVDGSECDIYVEGSGIVNKTGGYVNPWTTITLDQQTGTGGTDTVSIEYSDEAMPQATMPAKTGYTFGGYYTGKNGSGTKLYNADGTSACDFWERFDTTLTLYAQWTVNEYKFTFDKAGGTGGPELIETEYDASIDSITPPTHSDEDFYFNGYWNQQGEQIFNPSGDCALSKYNITEDMALTACWETTKEVSDMTEIAASVPEAQVEKAQELKTSLGINIGKPDGKRHLKDYFFVRTDTLSHDLYFKSTILGATDESVSLDIKPMDKASERGEVIEEKEIEVADGEEIQITMQAPATMRNSAVGNRVYIRHIKEDGTVYYLETLIKAGKIRFKQEHGFSQFDISTEPFDDPVFDGKSLLLGSDLGMNFYVKIPEGYEQGTMTFKISGKGECTSSDAGIYNDKNDRYRYTCKVNSLQMADTITATFTSGNFKISEQCSVADYLNQAKIEGSERMQDLADGIQNYGYYAQNYLAPINGFSLGDGENQYAAMIVSDAELSAGADLSKYAMEISANGNTEITDTSLALLLDSTVGLNVYMTLAENSTYNSSNKPSITVDSETLDESKIDFVAGENDETLMLVKIDNIPTSRLGHTYEVVVDDSYTVKASALSYANVLKSSGSSFAPQLAVAIYEYYTATMNYAGKEIE